MNVSIVVGDLSRIRSAVVNTLRQQLSISTNATSRALSASVRAIRQCS